MAESQDHIVYDKALIGALEASLSEARLKPYLEGTADDFAFAIHKYLWNARLSKAFLFPLQVTEIVTRNSIHRALSEYFGRQDWIVRLPSNFLNEKSEQSYNNAVRRLEQNGVTDPSPDQIVAALTFDFWSNLFRPSYEKIWSQEKLLRSCFPFMEAPYDWRYVGNRARRINALRNRIAHHEPIWNEEDLSGDYEKCTELIGISCKNTKLWVQKNSTVALVLRSPPDRDSHLPGLPLSSAKLKRPVETTPDEKLFDLARRMDDSGSVGAVLKGNINIVITNNSLVKSIMSASKAADGYVDLNSISVKNIIVHGYIRTVSVKISDTTGDVAAKFYPMGVNSSKRPSHAIVLDENLGEIVGLIDRPVVRYR